ncbi:MAG: hypothetical protein FWH16_05415 [Oscillospiraceae bacterium]|nr:hypothetical protein [Oscillospiraceae bacterium]
MKKKMIPILALILMVSLSMSAFTADVTSQPACDHDFESGSCVHFVWHEELSEGERLTIEAETRKQLLAEREFALAERERLRETRKQLLAERELMLHEGKLAEGERLRETRKQLREFSALRSGMETRPCKPQH